MSALSVSENIALCQIDVSYFNNVIQLDTRIIPNYFNYMLIFIENFSIYLYVTFVCMCTQYDDLTITSTMDVNETLNFGKFISFIHPPFRGVNSHHKLLPWQTFQPCVHKVFRTQRFSLYLSLYSWQKRRFYLFFGCQILDSKEAFVFAKGNVTGSH